MKNNSVVSRKMIEDIIKRKLIVFIVADCPGEYGRYLFIYTFKYYFFWTMIDGDKCLIYYMRDNYKANNSFNKKLIINDYRALENIYPDYKLIICVGYNRMECIRKLIDKGLNVIDVRRGKIYIS